MSFAATFLSQEKSFFQEVKVEIFIIDVFFLLLFAFHFAPALVMSSCEHKKRLATLGIIHIWRRHSLGGEGGDKYWGKSAHIIIKKVVTHGRERSKIWGKKSGDVMCGLPSNVLSHIHISSNFKAAEMHNLFFNLCYRENFNMYLLVRCRSISKIELR